MPDEKLCVEIKRRCRQVYTYHERTERRCCWYSRTRNLNADCPTIRYQACSRNWRTQEEKSCWR